MTLLAMFRNAMLGATLLVAACGEKERPKTDGLKPTSDPIEVAGRRQILGFETSDTAVTWAPRKTSATTLGRSSVRAKEGLWSSKLAAEPGGDGDVVHNFKVATDLGKYDTLAAGVIHTDTPSRSNEWQARLFVVDADGTKIKGDPLPVTSRWQDLLLDLRTAAEEGADVSRIVTLGLELTNVGKSEAPLDIQTDDWAVQREGKKYLGDRSGAAKSFYVERQGMRLRVGVTGQYEVTFHQRSSVDRGWMTVTGPGGRVLLGQRGTGLMLLDQGRFDALGAGVRTEAFQAGGELVQSMPTGGWPIRAEAEGMSTWRWECVWTSPVGAIVEMKQEVGPLDRLGEPAARLTWRFMIYQWGQMFVHVDWGKVGEGGGRPMSWALVTEDRGSLGEAMGVEGKSGEVSDEAAERLLGAVYPASVRQGLQTALPHQMQAGATAAMIAKAAAGTGGKNLWWWARGNGRRVFGSGIDAARAGTSADCMLLVNAPNALTQAGGFGAYLVPAKVKVRQGELDRNFPGDIDNDGLVDSYGFQVVRLSGGRASFVIYPQERPLFYPPYLFTVPAAEREAVDLKNSRVLINIDGKQFADPPQFPDGSFLLQMPYVIDRPVSVEAVLVRK